MVSSGVGVRIRILPTPLVTLLGPRIFKIEIVITQPRIVRFRKNLTQSLITWQPIYYKGQRSRSQRDVKYQHSLEVRNG